MMSRRDPIVHVTPSFMRDPIVHVMLEGGDGAVSFPLLVIGKAANDAVFEMRRVA